eukprot:CAMPEP_0172801182 /NCGR_PEP_ID=MMETSP1075-20121228/3021_1 /TAXON_ID=2916 /ORGANISM="Ceratium fusus, Strain PA161109" /LENGTH=108 /DNA_ID=CAMNT_0013639179 /DNA_START=75 /DNA_END=402 /DNA_ORIENTATION=+
MSGTLPSERKFMQSSSLDHVTAEHPHMDDPRFLSLTNQMNHCILRFQVFARCARELGEEDTAANTSTFVPNVPATSPSSRIGWSTEHAGLATLTCCRTAAPSIAASEM